MMIIYYRKGKLTGKMLEKLLGKSGSCKAQNPGDGKSGKDRIFIRAVPFRVATPLLALQARTYIGGIYT